MIIGITGGTGCGKTTALKAFEELGGVVFDCDVIYHDLLKTDKALLKAICHRFPGCVTKGVLDRKKLGGIVFEDPAALQALNEIAHGAVKKKVLQLLEGQTRPVAIDAIGLFEGGLAQLCHTTVAVTAPEECRILRIMKRDNISRQYAQSRISAQRPQGEFVALCQYELHNDAGEQEFHQKSLAFFKQLGIMK